MCRSITLLCLIGLGRSRVIFCHLRAIGLKSSNFLLLVRYRCLYISVYEIWNAIWNEWRIETRRGMMMGYRYGSRIGFLGVLAPSVSIEDRTVVGPADHV